MPKSIQRIKNSKPELAEDSGIKALTDDIDTYESIEIVADSEGGKIILDSLKRDVMAAILSLSQFKKATHTELIALCATVTERLNMYKMMTNAKKNKTDALKALSEIIDA